MYKTISDIRQANEAQGGKFFDEGWLKFFNSHVEPIVYGGHYFITGERFRPENPPLYTVRYADDSGKVSTVGRFNECPTLAAAKLLARAAAATGGN